MIDSLLDTILDRSVVGGYTRVGYRIRSRTWQASDVQPLEGKVVVVSGASSGIGLAAAEGFARLGASVRLLVRSDERGAQARAAIIERAQNSDVQISVCDLSSLESVRGCATRLAAQERVHVLVNNASVMTQERALSADGIELTLATNVVGPFLLTNLLIPLLKESAPARVINVSSGGMYTQRITVDDLQSEHGRFDGPSVYARTKRAQVILTEIWAGRLADTGGRGPRDASRLGGHPGRAILAASLLQGDAAAAQNARAGRRRDRLARSCGRTEPQLWPVLARPPTAPHAAPAVHEGDATERLWAECERLSGWQDPRTLVAARSNR
jgi:dehydrogenase/reductase SDR family member 12